MDGKRKVLDISFLVIINFLKSKIRMKKIRKKILNRQIKKYPKNN